MTTVIPFNHEADFAPGRVDMLSPLLRRVVAPNPGPFTFKGTNTYIVGRGAVAIIDPGPDIQSHVEAILAAIAGETVTHILVTHTHSDHSPAAAPLKARTGAPTYGYGPHGAGKAEEGVRVEEGGDMAFVPDHRLTDATIVRGKNWTLEAVYTPGHTSNHLCYALQDEAALVTGDHVMGWSTSVVTPPDGDMAQYMASLEKLRRRGDKILWPAHGGPVREPEPYLSAFVAHREEREAAIAACLVAGIGRIPDMVAKIYTDTGRHLHAAAARSVHAHLIRMVAEGRARCEGEPILNAIYRA